MDLDFDPCLHTPFNPPEPGYFDDMGKILMLPGHLVNRSAKFENVPTMLAISMSERACRNLRRVLEACLHDEKIACIPTIACAAWNGAELGVPRFVGFHVDGARFAITDPGPVGMTFAVKASAVLDALSRPKVKVVASSPCGAEDSVRQLASLYRASADRIRHCTDIKFDPMRIDADRETIDRLQEMLVARKRSGHRVPPHAGKTITLR